MSAQSRLLQTVTLFRTSHFKAYHTFLSIHTTGLDDIGSFFLSFSQASLWSDTAGWFMVETRKSCGHPLNIQQQHCWDISIGRTVIYLCMRHGSAAWSVEARTSHVHPYHFKEHHFQYKMYKEETQEVLMVTNTWRRKAPAIFLLQDPIIRCYERWGWNSRLEWEKWRDAHTPSKKTTQQEVHSTTLMISGCDVDPIILALSKGNRHIFWQALHSLHSSVQLAMKKMWSMCTAANLGLYDPPKWQFLAK